MPLACVWHEELFYNAGPVPQNSASGLADGKSWVSCMPERIYHADSHNQPCVWNLYKRTFGVTNQLATCIICIKRALHHG